MTRLLLSAAEITVSMAAVIFLLLMLNRAAGERFTAKCRYILWCVVILRLAIPVGAPVSASLIRIEIPEPVITEPAAEQVPDLPDAVTDVLLSDAEYETTSSIPETSQPARSTETEAGKTAEPDSPAMQENEILPAPVVTSDPVIPDGGAENTGFTPARELLLPGNTGGKRGEFAPSLPDSRDAFNVIGAVWLTGAAVFFLAHWIQHAAAVSSLRRSRRTVSRAMHERYDAVCEACGLKHCPTLFASAEVTGPILFGYFRPCILLPLNVDDPDKTEGILRHELTHYRRGDLWIKLACLTAQSLHWFNPLVHLAAARCVREMELSCDEAVLDGLGEHERQEYGLVMLDVVRFCRSRQSGLTTQFNPKRSVVRERFENILDMRRKKRGPALIAAVTAVCLCLPMIVSCTVKSESADTAQNANDTVNVKEEYGYHKPAGIERIVLGTEHSAVKSAFADADRLISECRIEYGDYLAIIDALGESMTLMNTADDPDAIKEAAEKSRLLRSELHRSASYIGECVPGALFRYDGLTVSLDSGVIGRSVLLPGEEDSVFAVGYSMTDNSVHEIFRIIRQEADGLTAESITADGESVREYFAWDGVYFYAFEYPAYRENNLRSECILHIRSDFIIANDSVYAVSDSHVSEIAKNAASASYETCLSNMEAGIWSPAVVIHNDVVRSMTAKLINRIAEYLGEGRSVGGITVAGAQVNGSTSETLTLTLPADAELPAVIAAQDVGQYFVKNRYDLSDCSFEIPMGTDYLLRIRFVFLKDMIRITEADIVPAAELPEYSINIPSDELYARYRAGELTQTELLSYPSVHADIARIAEEVFLELDGTAPRMSEIRSWFTDYPDGTIELIARVAGDTCASVRLAIGEGMELVSVKTGKCTEIAVSYKAVYDLYEAKMISEHEFYESSDVQIRVIELINSVFDALRRGEDANALWNTPGFTPPATLPEGVVIKRNMTQDMLINNRNRIRMNCPAYDSERIQIKQGCHLQVWYEITAAGLRPVSSMIFEPHIDYSAEVLDLSVLYPDYANGKREMAELLGQRTVQTNLLALYRRACVELTEAGFDAVLPAELFSAISDSTRIPEYVAYTAQGCWAICVKSGDKILEIGFEIRTDGTPRAEIATITLLESGKTDRTLLLEADVNGMNRPCAVTIPAVNPFEAAEITALAEERGILALTHGTDVTYTDIALTGESGGVMWFNAE